MKAVLLAAGEGTRLGTFTKHVHKCMIPFAGRPFLEWSLQTIADSGKIEEIIIVVGHKSEQITGHFGKSFRGIKISYVTQDDLFGTADALNRTRHLLRDEEFLAILADVYPPPQLLEKLIAHSGTSLLSLTTVDDPGNHAGIRVSGNEVLKVRTDDITADRGIWKFTPEIFSYLSTSKKVRGEQRILEAVQDMIDNNVTVEAEAFQDEWVQIGDHDGEKGILKTKDFFLDKAGLSNYTGAKTVKSRIEKSSVEVPVYNSTIVNSLIFGEGKLQDTELKDTVALLKNGEILKLEG